MISRHFVAATIAAGMVLSTALSVSVTVADHTPDPAAVAIAGSLQSELGCPGDWQPECAATELAFDAEDGVWQGSFNVPAGAWEYKAPLNDLWDENYGANAQLNGANIALALGAATDVKFYYDHDTHWVTDNVNSTIATAAGSFQSALGCSGDWQPDCLQSWLQDPDGDGVYEFSTDAIPAGSHEFKVALGEAWDTSYPAGNVPFTSATGDTITFTYTSATNEVAVAIDPFIPPSVTIAGSLQDELGCPGDWQPDCAATHLVYDAVDDVWQGTFSLPAGSYEYKAAINDSWDENYGANAQFNGANIAFDLAIPTDVKFYFDETTKWVTDSVNSTIATAAGSFQSELGCPGDWQPDCLARGCRTSTAMAPTRSPPTRSQPATTSSRSPSTRAGPRATPAATSRSPRPTAPPSRSATTLRPMTCRSTRAPAPPSPATSCSCGRLCAKPLRATSSTS